MTDTAARAIALAADAEIDKIRSGFRATLRGNGGAATIGYGDTADAARADLAATIEFNLIHNGRAVI
ncbi:hypothetical protein SEA_BOILGATE_79 [Mycobacterium phage Boilgate]|nr:hypothetical protein SEA_BOILGATE_79 [Mycobacterium phage Boilgate]